MVSIVAPDLFQNKLTLSNKRSFDHKEVSRAISAPSLLKKPQAFFILSIKACPHAFHPPQRAYLRF
jgi:hypothetical protein